MRGDQQHPNARRVLDAYAQLDAGDVRAFFGLFHRDLRFQFVRAMPSIAGTYDGRQAWIDGMLMPMLAITDGSFAPRPVWTAAVGEELVLSHFRVRFTLNGTPREVDAALVFRLGGDRVIEAWDIVAPEDALAEDLESALAAHKGALPSDTH